MVYARETEQQVRTFLVSGLLWRNSMVMVDRETGTWWSHVLGTAVAGADKGRELRKLPSVQTTWAEWRAANPETSLLRKTEAVLSSPYQGYFDDPERMGVFRSRWLVSRMPGKAVVFGVALGPHAVAVSEEALAAGAVVKARIGDVPVVVTRGAAGGVRAFVARVGESELLLRRTRRPGVYVDEGSGTSWQIGKGLGVAGPLIGRTLEELPVTRGFWFAWSSFYPNTQVIDSAPDS